MARISTLLLVSMLTTACSQATYVPSRTPLAKLVDKGAQTTVSIGDQQAAVSPFNDRYVSLFREQARSAATQSHRDRRRAFWLNLPAAAAGIAVLVLAVSDWNATSDIDTRTGKAALSLTLGSAVIGAFSSRFAAQARTELDEAVSLHNDVVYGEAAPPVAAPEPPAVIPPDASSEAGHGGAP